MIGEKQENELSTCQCIKALSCHILTRSHTHSSPQCLNLMSQVSLNGSCIHQHYHTAIISLCYRQFITLYSSASISIRCCHDLHPSYCHVTYSLVFSTAYAIWWMISSHYTLQYHGRIHLGRWVILMGAVGYQAC